MPKKTLTNQVIEPSMTRRWLVLTAASSLFFFIFIQTNMFNPIGSSLMRDFSINANQLGFLSSMFFYGNALLLLPAGVLLDRFSARKLLVLSLLLASISMFIFAFSTSYTTACISRLMMGFCGGFSFIGAMRVVSRWFPTKMLALASGLITTIGMLGGVIAQTPIAYLNASIGWRHTIIIFGFVGIALLLYTFFVVRDYPNNDSSIKVIPEKITSKLGFWHSIRLVILNRYNWFCGLYTALMNLPIWLLGALWGSIYLMQHDHLTSVQAANVISQLFVGVLIGAPLVGWLSDKIGRRVLPMIIGAILSAIIMIAIMYLPDLSFTALIILFFFLGLVSSTQILSYPLVAESNSPSITGSAVSIVSLILVSSGFIAQPLFGSLLDLNWNHLMIKGMAIYSSGNFLLALWILPIGFIASIIVTRFIKESYCKLQY